LGDASRRSPHDTYSINVVVNLSAHPAQARIHPDVGDNPSAAGSYSPDLLTGFAYFRGGSEVANLGSYLDIIAGFVVTIVGVGVLLVMVTGNQSNWAHAPGLLLIGVIGLAAACLLARNL
jgi:hypothetical protein